MRKFGFGKRFITWIEILLKNQLSQYYNSEREVACRGNLISGYHFMLTLEILFLLTKEHPKIIKYCFLYSAYADDTKDFLEDSQSIAYLVEIFNTFSPFP